MINLYLNNDAKKIQIENESIDLIITHPPYLGVDQERYGGIVKKQINYKNNYKKMLKNLNKVTNEMHRVLKNSGNIFICIGPANGMPFRYITKVLQQKKLILKSIVINNYNKDNNQEWLNQEIMIWFHLVKSVQESYINPFEIKKNSSTIYNFKSNNIDDPIDQELQKFFPHANIQDSLNIDFCDTIIKCFSKPNDIVLDVMGGTGVVAMSAVKNNRFFIHNDISPLQTKITKKRLEIFEKIKRKEK